MQALESVRVWPKVPTRFVPASCLRVDTLGAALDAPSSLSGPHLFFSSIADPRLLWCPPRLPSLDLPRNLQSHSLQSDFNCIFTLLLSSTSPTSQSLHCCFALESYVLLTAARCTSDRPLVVTTVPLSNHIPYSRVPSQLLRHHSPFVLPLPEQPPSIIFLARIQTLNLTRTTSLFRLTSNGQDTRFLPAISQQTIALCTK